jgi:succinoglycan biosynthesis protein ExoM
MSAPATLAGPFLAGPDSSHTKQRIAVCIATYKRPHLLAALLQGLHAVIAPAGYAVELRIIDNDANASAQATVSAFAKRSQRTVHYAVEPVRNIALARNAALDAGPAELLAFIDDDEVPAPNWLIELVHAIGADLDLVIGEVVPQFATEPPAWITRGRFHHKHAGCTGQRIHWNSTRTSNTMLRGTWVYDRGVRFDARFGKTGAEDTELFKRIATAGGVFAAAPAALVHEHVHAEQCRIGWLLQRFWRNGINYERLLSGDGGRHPLYRFAGRTLRGVRKLLLGLPLSLCGRSELLVHAALELARACGGLVAWLSPATAQHSPGYRSSGCEQ